MRMKDLYIKPEVELKKFNMTDVISTSGGDDTNDNEGWSGFYDENGNPINLF